MFMAKLIYLAKRKPGFTHDQFTARWRKHGALAMSLSLWRYMDGYAHADVLHPTPISGASEDYDGVGLIWVKGEDMWRNPQPGDMKDVETLLEDEKQTFSHPIPEYSLICDEEVLRDDGDGRITIFLYFNNNDQARKIAQSLSVSLDKDVQRIVFNTPKNLGAFADPVLPYRGVLELSARTGEKLRRVLHAQAPSLLQDANLAVVTRVAQLWG